MPRGGHASDFRGSQPGRLRSEPVARVVLCNGNLATRREGAPTTANTPPMDGARIRDMPDLELALLRRGVDDLAADCERCQRCRRTPLIGERVYVYDSGAIACELCRALEREAADWRRTGRARARVRAHDADHRPARATQPPEPALAQPRPATRVARAATYELLAPVDPFTVSTTIAKPREEVFEYLADIANHAEFTDHYLVDWHLTREDPYGTGAGARFRIKAPLSRFSWADVTFAELQPPYQDRRAWPRRQVQPDPDARDLHAVAGRGRYDQGRVHARDRARDAVRQADGDVRRPRLEPPPGREGDAPAAIDPRGGTAAGAAARPSQRTEPTDTLPPP